MKLVNMVKIHNRVSMHAKKTIWIEYGLEPLDVLPNKMRRLSHMQSNMIPRRLKPRDIFDSYKDNFFACFHGQSLQELAPHRPDFRGARTLISANIPTENSSRFGHIKGSLEPLCIEWLDEYVRGDRGKCRQWRRIIRGNDGCGGSLDP